LEKERRARKRRTQASMATSTNLRHCLIVDFISSNSHRRLMSWPVNNKAPQPGLSPEVSWRACKTKLRVKPAEGRMQNMWTIKTEV